MTEQPDCFGQFYNAAECIITALWGAQAADEPNVQALALYLYDNRGIMKIGCSIDPIPEFLRQRMNAND